MSADDPISALQALNDSDERQQSPIRRFAKPFLESLKLFSDSESQFTLSAFSIAVDWINRQQTENHAELLKELAAELKYRGAQIESLRKGNEEHCKFVADELPGLVLDGIRRAEGIRSKGRIKRLARILVRAAEVGPLGSADYAEEMLRIATELEDRDVLVLREIVQVQGPRMQKDLGRVKHFEAHSVFGGILGSLKTTGLLQGQVDSICAKLESFGLVSRTERNVNLIANDPTPYALLQKGLDFVDYLKSADDLRTTGAVSDL